jgi:hypothetical protein
MRVLFFPVVMNLADKFAVYKKGETKLFNRGNNPQRGIRGIHVGMPIDAPGYLVYIPSTHQVRVSADVYFDEQFRSTLAHMPGPFAQSFPLAVVDSQSQADGAYHFTDDALAFQDTRPDDHTRDFKHLVVRPLPTEPPVPLDKLDYIPEDDAATSSAASVQEEDPALASLASPDDGLSRPSSRLITPTLIQLLPEGYEPEEPVGTVPPRHINAGGARRSTRVKARPDVNYSERALARQHLHAVNHALTCLQAHPDPIGQDVLDEMHQAYHLEVVAPITTLAGTGPDSFMPAPETWRSMMHLPDTIKKHWVESLKKEIKALISKETFVPETPRPDDVITPVTAKFRVKLQAAGTIDKLKTRIALRGDLLKELIDAPDTWCPIAGFLL